LFDFTASWLCFDVLQAEGKVKGGAAARRGFGPNFSLVAVDDALDDGQPNACAFKFMLVVQALKDAK